MSIASRITRLEIALTGPAVGCDSCRTWPTARERVLLLLERVGDDNDEPSSERTIDPWAENPACPQCGRTPGRVSLVDLIWEAERESQQGAP